MLLEFEQKHIKDELFKELGFSEYLDLFNDDLPIIAGHIFRPLSQQEGETYFSDIIGLENKITTKSCSIDKLIEKCKELPNLDAILPALKNGQLDQFHFKALGSFIECELGLEEIENDFSFKQSQLLSDMKANILTKFNKGYTRLKLSNDALALTTSKKELQGEHAILLKEYENEIEQQFQVKMIYPYPKELAKEKIISQDIFNSKLLKVQDKGEYVTIDYNLPESISKQVEKLDCQDKELTEYFKKELDELNQKLTKNRQEFIDHYKARQQRSLKYRIISTKQKNDLVFPMINSDKNLCIEEAKLSKLEQLNPKQYNPLSISINHGSSVLFGANMGGKTTVLKTVYFQLMLIKMGLPTPAKKFETFFPDRIHIHLKSSGSIDKKLSSFGEELSFFETPFSDNSIVLVDELFQSTNPVSGTELSKLFLEHYKESPIVTLVTTQYSEILSQPDLQLFKVSDDFSFKVTPVDRTNISEELETNLKPLEIALNFSLPKELKTKIKKKIKG